MVASCSVAYYGQGSLWLLVISKVGWNKTFRLIIWSWSYKMSHLNITHGEDLLHEVTRLISVAWVHFNWLSISIPVKKAFDSWARKAGGKHDRSQGDQNGIKQSSLACLLDKKFKAGCISIPEAVERSTHYFLSCLIPHAARAPHHS